MGKEIIINDQERSYLKRFLQFKVLEENKLNVELEAIIGKNNSNNGVSYNEFVNLLKFMKTKKYPCQKSNQLDISFHESNNINNTKPLYIRLTIEGESNISQFCKLGEINPFL